MSIGGIGVLVGVRVGVFVSVGGMGVSVGGSGVLVSVATRGIAVGVEVAVGMFEGSGV